MSFMVASMSVAVWRTVNASVEENAPVDSAVALSRAENAVDESESKVCQKEGKGNIAGKDSGDSCNRLCGEGERKQRRIAWKHLACELSYSGAVKYEQHSTAIITSKSHIRQRVREKIT
ncbi:hypothetical protein GALMADRAFT_217119 [Galerina marginata CBS 339.88]|uniref:Uncharacterized protein n=1 Tax=Galerina marginata (strain CBS 339.88) TaxID=685588 RepID=A0A067S8I8_GALM3|nr:hypothetical protein GALMADRAFT_217119 [Galerina marginata CBS 339.88]